MWSVAMDTDSVTVRNIYECKRFDLIKVNKCVTWIEKII